MRVGILCNGRDLARWQLRAIEQIAGDHEIWLLITNSAAPARRSPRHLLYYALNVMAIRNRLTRRVQFPTGAVTIAGSIRFTPRFDGAWAVIPDDIVDWVRDQRLDAIVKFELNLLRIPPLERLPVPILSYHHGDPRRYRGRPAGFYEMLNGEPVMGQVVQVLSNQLDAGEVAAFADSMVVHHSYRQTLLEAYGLSHLLLPRALQQIAAGKRLDIEPRGPNYRLPSNGMVLRFVARMAKKLTARIGYGLLVEKRWKVATVDTASAPDPLAALGAADAARGDWAVIPIVPPHSFYADCFFHAGIGDILVEAFNRRSGKGELLRLHGAARDRLHGLRGHASYPFCIEEDGELYVIPEIATWSRPSIFRIEGEQMVKVADFDIDECRILDPTLLRHDGRVYLFGNVIEDGPAVLRLWSAPKLFGRFEQHAASPIRVSARGSRMAGEVGRWGSVLYRLGQDWRGGYGNGVVAFRIERLTATEYEEVEAGSAAFAGVCGPHTLNRRGGVLLFDWYQERVSPLAGVRRIASRL